MQDNQKAFSVVVTGDVTIDWNIAHHSHELREPTDWTGESSCSMNWQYGSAVLVADLISTVAKQLNDSKTHSIAVSTPDTPAQIPACPYDPKSTHSYAIWAPYRDKEAGKSEPGDPRWRIERFLGVDLPSVKAVDRAQGSRSPQGPAYADIIVIDDSNQGFRDHHDRWPQAIKNAKSGDDAPWIIVKMAPPVAKGELWDHLVSTCPDKLVAVLTIDDLRQSEMQVSARISWELTAQELAWELVHNHDINGLTNAAYCIVSFGPAGALLLPGHQTKGENPKILFDPVFMEGEWSAGKGMLIGKTSTLIAGIVREILLDSKNTDIAKGMQSGISAMRHLIQIGYDSGTGPSPRLCFPAEKILAKLMSEESPLAVAELPTVEKGSAVWTILRDKYHDGLEPISQRIVLEGTKKTLTDVPTGRFGYLVTVDRREIESLRSVASLIKEYCNRGEERPVSIAVFGPPGAGKSFAVKQIAKVADPESIAEKTLTFNLSQFNSPDELNDAFHQIRDIGLSGKIPLVFWDEFDTKLDGNPLGWLRFFLAPMQDGEFQQGQLSHPIGKAIFVFAGGTSPSIDEFMKQKNLKEAKGPDFLSRLKGFLNVLGPNRQEVAGNDDPYFIVRRALLLRSLFERLTPQLIDEKKIIRIDTGILRALLHIKEYKHGARSMESIIAMSRLGRATHFNRSNLPPEEQLVLHVDPKEFISLVHKLELDGELLETLAKLNHEFFCNSLVEKGYVWGVETNDNANPKTHSSLKPYDKLPEHEKEQNRGAVRDIPNKLANNGYAMVPRRNNERDYVFPAEVLEEMAKAEHERWMQAKFKEDWTYAPVTDKKNNKHALLIEWDKLPDDERKKDLQIIETMSIMLKKAGYTIVELNSSDEGKKL
ncbi:MAG: ATPase [Chlorobiaceae bacterium]|nr:ATPase [Chlorobiaceae bacterium]